MNVYPVLETDLQAISMFNGLTATFASVGAGFLTFALGLIVQAIFVASGPAEEGNELKGATEALTYVGAPVCLVMAVLFAALAFWAYKSRGTRLADIEEQTTYV